MYMTYMYTYPTHVHIMFTFPICKMIRSVFVIAKEAMYSFVLFLSMGVNFTCTVYSIIYTHLQLLSCCGLYWVCHLLHVHVHEEGGGVHIVAADAHVYMIMMAVYFPP